LSIRRVVREFPPLLFACFMRRMIVQYLLFDINIGSASFLAGLVLSLFGAAVGVYEWTAHVTVNQPTPTGLIMLSVLPLIVGSQLLLSAFLYDVLQAPRTLRVTSTRQQVEKHDDVPTELDRIIPRHVRAQASIAVAIVSSVLFLLWFGVVASKMYGVSPTALRLFGNDIRHVPEILTRLPRNITSLVLTCSFVFSAIFPGYVLTALCRLRWHSFAERLLFSTVFGLVLYTFAFLGFGSAALLKPMPLFVLTAVCLVGAIVVVARSIVQLARSGYREQSTPSRTEWMVGAVLAVYLYISLLQGLSPEYRFDAMWYHFAEARRWALHGGFDNLITTTRSLTAAIPHYQEDLYAGLVAMFGLIAAKLLAWIDLPLAVFAIYLLVRRFLGSSTLGLTAGLIFASTPIIVYCAGSAANDLPLAVLTTLAMYALVRWREQPDALGWLFLTGALAGYSMGVKSTGLFTVLVCAGFIAVHGMRTSKFWPSAGVFGGAAALFAAPSMIQAWFWTHDPIFPILPTLFKSPYFMPQLMAPDWFASYAAHLPQHILEFFTLPWSLTIDSDAHVSIVGPIFLVMLPAALVAVFAPEARRSVLRYIGLFAVLWMALFNLWPTLYLRYAEAIVPIGSILAATPPFFLGRTTRARKILGGTLAVTLAAMIALNNPFLVPFQVGSLIPGKEGQQQIDWAYLYEGAPYHFEPPTNDRVIGYMNEHFSRDTVVYENASLFIWTLYADPEMVEPEPTPGSWTLVSPDSLEQLRKYHVQYVVVFAGELPLLQKVPLGAHLQEVQRFPPNEATGSDAAHAIILLRLD
jgi:hypothetical protein